MSREKKKKSDKPKYCEFEGVICVVAWGEVPKKLACPICKRRMAPDSRMTYVAEPIVLSFKKHRRKK